MPIYTSLDLKYLIGDIVVEIMSIASPVYENISRLGELLKPRSWDDVEESALKQTPHSIFQGMLGAQWSWSQSSGLESWVSAPT